MDIQEINKDVISYLGQMIKNDEDYDIHNLSEKDYDNIIQTYLNDWEEKFDIVTEYYGNTNIFIPSLDALMEMMDLITKMRIRCDCDTDWSMFAHEKNNLHRYCVILRLYAYHYVYYIGYEMFLEELKEWIDDNVSIEDDDESEDNFDYENSCDCCLKSWTDIENEFGFCSCICDECGDDLRNCRYKCNDE